VAKKILVVEDNEMNMKLFSDVLESRGYDTTRAYSGMAALQLTRAHDWDLIIVDIQLPDISGLDVTRTIKDHPFLKPVPILAVTAFAMKGDEEKFRAAGCDAYMAKPIRIMEFIELVEKLLADSENPSERPDLSDDEDAAKRR
jgi:two-component system cell cycle response regulator DivK